MFKSSVQQYTLIYSLNSLFYKLVIESNIKSIIDEIITELNTMVLSNNSTIIKFKKPTKLFKIISNDILDIEDYKNIFKSNPFIINNINIPQKIDISYYYKTSLLKPNNLGNIVNLYTEVKSYIYTNSINGETYINEFIKYKKSKLNLDCDKINYEDSYTQCSLQICIPNEVIINCVFFNLNNSGYDIIESIDNDSNKIVLYIVPHNYNYKDDFLKNPEYRTKYLGNILDLDDTSLPILYELKKKYANKTNLCFIHYTNTLFFYTLHFHIIPEDKYKLIYPKLENGQNIIQDLFIDKIINNIKANKNFYLELNLELILPD